MQNQRGFVGVGVLIAILIGVAVLGGGAYYVMQQQAPTQTASENFETALDTQTAKTTPAPQVPKSPTPLTRENVKVGDKVGGLVVTDIRVIALPSGDPKRDLRINFSGETIVTGTYTVGGFSGPDEVSINVNKTDNSQLSYFLLDSGVREVFITLSNPVVARQALTANSGKVSMRIKNLSTAWATGTEAVTTAEFVALSISGSLTYVHSTNAIDPQTNKLGVSFQYTTKPLCDSRSTKDSFSIETGDGRTYAADCGGVVDHVYVAAGEYRARYLRNGSEIASVQVNLTSISFTAPTTGATLQADQQTTVRWTIPTATLNSFPQDFDVYVFLYVQKQGDAEGVNAGIGDGHKAVTGSATWNIPAYIMSGSLKSGAYKITAQLQATPKDQTRLCDPVASQGKHECVPNAADSAVMLRSSEIKGETGLFTIAPSATVKDNNAPVITSLTGPTSLRVGEKGTWLLTATDDTATSLKYSCYIGFYREMQGPGGSTFMGSSGGRSFLPDQHASPGASVAFTFSPSNPTMGKEYYDISCDVGEPLPNNGELGARYQKSVQFTVSP